LTIVIVEFGFTFADSKNIQKIIAKRIAVLFTFSIVNKSIAIAFVSISNNFVLLEAS